MEQAFRVGVTAAAALAFASAACSSRERNEKKKAPAEERAQAGTGQGGDDAAGPPTNTTVNAFFGRGLPTFVAGTAGDDRADEAIAAQIDLVRGLLFPSARRVADASLEDEWPKRPVLYGGAHVNSRVAALDLPFVLRAGELSIGGETFSGESYFLAAVVPAALGRPEILVLGGTGTPGIAGINAGLPGRTPIAILDEFGLLTTGRWRRSEGGHLVAELSARARRLPWRTDSRALDGAGGQPTGVVRVHFLRDHPVDNEEELADACVRGIATSARKLGIRAPEPVSVYVYPDSGSKRSLTGRAGSGHAIVAMRALHVAPADPSPGGALERLVAHEGTHVLAHQHLRPERAPFLAEGLAVWVSGGYGQKTLSEWRDALRGRVEATPAELLGPRFRELPEKDGYPMAGLFVQAAVRKVGIEAFGAHLLGASRESWVQACRRAGTTADALAEAFAGQVAP